MTASRATAFRQAILASPGWLLFALSALSCFLFVFMIPPFQAPDEQQHFYRSYSLTDGILTPEPREEAVGAMLPASLPETVETFLKSRALHAKRPLLEFHLQDVESERARALDPDRREFVAFSDAALVGPVAYAPQVLGMTIGKALGAAPIDLLYWARLANALATLAAAGFALRLLGGGITWAHCILALPMTQAVFASASPDATMIASALIMVGCLASKLTTPGAERRARIVLFAASAVLVISKSVYVGIPVLGAIVAAYRGARLGMPRRGAAFGLALVVMALVLAAAWGMVISTEHLAVVSHPVEPGAPPVDQGAQVAFVLADPLRFLEILLVTTLHSAVFYVTSTIGILGWLSVPMPIPAYVAAALALCLAFTQPPPEGAVTPIWIKLLAVCAVLGSLALIQLALYIRWTSVGAPTIEGVQGRYLLPVLFLLTLAQTPVLSRALPAPLRNLAIVGLLTLTMVLAHYAVFVAYD